MPCHDKAQQRNVSTTPHSKTVAFIGTARYSRARNIFSIIHTVVVVYGYVASIALLVQDLKHGQLETVNAFSATQLACHFMHAQTSARNAVLPW